jgi:hypothetical protein
MVESRICGHRSQNIAQDLVISRDCVIRHAALQNLRPEPDVYLLDGSRVKQRLEPSGRLQFQSAPSNPGLASLAGATFMA